MQKELIQSAIFSEFYLFIFFIILYCYKNGYLSMNSVKIMGLKRIVIIIIIIIINHGFTLYILFIVCV